MGPKGEVVKRAFQSQSLWLTVTYFGLIMLMAKAYAS